MSVGPTKKKKTSYFLLQQRGQRFYLVTTFSYVSDCDADQKSDVVLTATEYAERLIGRARALKTLLTSPAPSTIMHHANYTIGIFTRSDGGMGIPGPMVIFDGLMQLFDKSLKKCVIVHHKFGVLMMRQVFVAHNESHSNNEFL